jgi:predicted esterase
VLLLLHGFCDTDLNFASFGTKLQLPQTAVLAIRAPIPLLDMGFTWFDVLTSSGDVSFDSADAVASLRETSDAMLPLLQRLHQRQGYAMRNIFILGYSQGGTVALSVLHSLRDVAIGGVVSICGGPAPPPEPPSTPCSTTPVLFTLGQRDSAAESKARAWSQFEAARGGHTADCAMVIIKDKGEAMVQQGDEVRVLMQFFGQHLKLRSLQLYAQSDVVAVDNPQLMGALCASQGE